MCAFVAGNGNYKGLPPLKNPVPDASAMKFLLLAENVEVFHAYDCDIIEFEEQFSLFLAKLRPGDAALLYFAGHAVMYENSLRLMAMSNSAKPELERRSINVDFLKARLET